MTYGFHKATLLYIDRCQREGFATCSFENERLIDELVRQLHFNGCFSRMNYAYIFAQDGGADMCRVNLRQPLFASLGIVPGTQTHVTKKGLYGTGFFNTQFQPHADSCIGLLDVNNTSWSAYVTQGGGTTPVAIEYLSQFTDNTRYQTIRNRTNPRVDAIMNQTIANPVQIVATVSPSNTLVHCDVGSVAGSLTYSAWTNRTVRVTNIGGGGALPTSGVVVAVDGIPSTRQLGGIFGGLAVHGIYNQYDVNGGYSDAINSYMTSVQAL